MSAPIYWREKLYRYRLVASYCDKCNKKYYPPRPVCLQCGNTELREVKLPNTGTLISFTTVYQTFPEFSKLAPYVIGIIRLDDGTTIVA
ncbi:MAG TPA: Zn-ribbon domain-containing OB-fold protein, partial [Geobacterales bacterium]|nr:Zn-ribbon domain-containing OB-fold protein [Geobacterales bacterium]